MPSGLATKPPIMTHWQWSVPEENFQWPLKMKPPSTGRPTPMGAYGEATQVSMSSPQISSCRRRSARASSCGCTPTTPATQPVAASAEPTAAITAFMKSTGWDSMPPKRLGWSMRITPVSLSLEATSSVRRPAFSLARPLAAK